MRGKVRTPLNAPERLVVDLAALPRAIASGWRRLTCRALLPAALACFGLCGCASFWDDVTSRDFEFRSLWSAKPDPLVVLRDSKDGDKRAKALRSMPEPAQFGEPQEQQDAYVKILCTAVVSERTALCRQAAIASLRTYKDPRVSEALQKAYYSASDYPPETATILRCQALEALGQVGNPNAVKLLTEVVKEPPIAKGAEADRQQLLEQRIAAARRWDISSRWTPRIRCSPFSRRRKTPAYVTWPPPRCNWRLASASPKMRRRGTSICTTRRTKTPFSENQLLPIGFGTW